MARRPVRGEPFRSTDGERRCRARPAGADAMGAAFTTAQTGQTVPSRKSSTAVATRPSTSVEAASRPGT
jgi:hypothetical protein